MKHLLLWALTGFSMSLASLAHAQPAEKIMIDGSTGVTPLVAALAKAYNEQNPTVAIDIGKGMGTSARINALRDGKIDIAMASHGLKVDDIKREGMAVHEIAKVAVVFGVHAGVAVNALTEAQICDIYLLNTTNWKELGAADITIAPYTRPDTEVDTEVVRDKIACLTKLQMPAGVKVAPKAGEMSEQLATAAGAIGMTTMTMIEQSKGRIKPLALRGIMPTTANVQNKTYPLTRDSFLVTRAAPAPAVAKFMAFVISDAGKRVIAANGAIPVK